MHNCIKHTKFTTKPCLHEIFSNLYPGFCVVFRREFLFTLLHWKFVNDKICNFIFKTRLDGEICSSDVIMHKGYCINLIFLYSFGEHLDPQQTQQRPGSAHSSASSQRWKRLSEYSFSYMYSTLIFKTILLGQMLVLLLQIQQYSWEMASTQDSTHTDRCSWMIIADNEHHVYLINMLVLFIKMYMYWYCQ